MPHEAVTVHVSDLGLRRGFAVFEMFRVEAGVPFFLEHHLARLTRSANVEEAIRPALADARRQGLLASGLGALVTVAGVLERRSDYIGARRLIAFLHGHPRATFETRRAVARLHCSEGAYASAGRDPSSAGILAEIDRAIAGP
ncbi:MAG: hypothetical protein H0U69_00405 [Trueperaceae bacterium]|nr:hypothetical protein [Trueperaceae bacterium]